MIRPLAILLGTALAGLATAQHSHVAPHGGTLVVLGDHFAHLEVSVDARRGELAIWVLDGEASAPIVLPQGAIELKVRKLRDARGATLREGSVALRAVAEANPLTGESASASSEFRCVHPALKGAARFEALVREMTVKGIPVRAFAFPYPEGNEEHAGGGHATP